MRNKYAIALTVWVEADTDLSESDVLDAVSLGIWHLGDAGEVFTSGLHFDSVEEVIR